MDERDEQLAVFASAVPFEDARIGAAAIYCSDGRMGEQFDDFLQNGLGLPRYDRLAVPGGPACLAGHFAAYREEEAAAAHLAFLLKVHKLHRIVLIAHQGCAFYTSWLQVSNADLLPKQREDLAKAAERVRGMRRDLEVEAFYARRDGEVVSFEPVPV